jgi:hypothetical protein
MRHPFPNPDCFALLYESSTMLPFSDTYIPSKNCTEKFMLVRGPRGPGLEVMMKVNAHLSDILVSHSADLLDIGGALRDGLERVALEDQLILLGLGDLDLNTGSDGNLADELLADEVSDLDLVVARLTVLLDIDVDGEMGIDVSHLVLVALRYADDQVVDEGADGAQRGDVLARAVVDLDADHVLGGTRKADGQVTNVLLKLACFPCVRLFRSSDPLQRRAFSTSGSLSRTSGTSNGDLAGLDADGDYKVGMSVLLS